MALIDDALGVASRRCWVPSDLSSVTSLGDEVGGGVAAEQIWANVESLYRSGMHPGIQLCVRHQGDVVVDRAIGYARGNLPGRWVDRDSATPMTVDTPVNLFSAAKAVSAMVMHKLEELGAFGLDDPVAEHLSGFERHGKGDITIRHLLTHRAGIAAWPGEAFDLDLLADPDRIVDVIRDLRPSAGPGGASAYHAVSGGFVMEAVTRAATGRSMRDVLAKEIKEPLGLDWLDFGVAPEDAASVAHNVETGFLPGPVIDLFIKRVLGKPWGRILRMSNDPRFLTSVIPSGNVIVTASDIAAFYQCLLDGGSLDGTRVFDEATITGAVSSDRGGLELDRMLAIPVRYSSGFMLGSETVSLYGWNHPRAFGHLGMSNLFTWADPDRALVVALLTTGKPVLGPHLPALVQLITGIHEIFPELEGIATTPQTGRTNARGGTNMTITDADTWNTPFLQGALAPVSDERDDEALEVIGEIPSGLDGMFVRTGPNPQFAPMGAYHPFDGDGMLHAVYLQDGTARYRNRWIESKGLLAERARGQACYGGMSNFQLPPDDVMQEGGLLKNTANTATVRHAGRYFSLMEAALPTEFDRDLRTLGECDFGGRLDGPFTAHPKVDPVTGDMIFFGYSATAPFLRYHEVDASGELVHSADIDLPAGVMMHDFAITERYAIFFDSPAVFDLDALLAGDPPMSWQPDNGTRIGVMPRRGTSSDIRWFEIDNCYVVHFSNAWDATDTIEVRAPRMPDMPGGFEAEPGPAREPMPWKWTLDLTTGSVVDEQTDDVPGEFPRVNEAFTGHRNRYGYDSTARGWDFDFDFNGVMQYDYERDTSAGHTYGPTEVSGEHVFAADPDGSAENDGWLMSFVTDRAEETSELAIIDARDVSAGPVARVKMAARVPIGFHANWFASD